jgi:hypothetical protein
MPAVQLRPVPGFNDDAAYIHSLSEQVTKLLDRAEKEESPQLQAQCRLAAANQILAFLLEPVCSRRILNLPIDPHDFGIEWTRSLLDQADGLLTGAEAIVEPGSEGADPRKEIPAGLPEHARTLRAFSGALRAYLLVGEDEERQSRARKAASQLSPLMEQDNPRVVAAATLWQALLRSMEDEPDRVLTVLDLALADLPPDSMPYTLFSRLLRCRLIAHRGGIAAASGLLLQLEERCQDWLTDDTLRDDAIRAIQLERIRIMALWGQQSSGEDAAASRRWCRERAASLVQEAFTEPGEAVMRLSPAVPVLIQPPGADPTPAQPIDGT